MSVTKFERSYFFLSFLILLILYTLQTFLNHFLPLPLKSATTLVLWAFYRGIGNPPPQKTLKKEKKKGNITKQKKSKS